MRVSNNIKLWLILCAGSLLACSFQATAGNISPSHVYQLNTKIIAEIQLIRHHLGTTSPARTPEIQIRKQPIHVYAKSLEVLEKIGRAQTKHDIIPIRLGHIPLHKISPSEVLASSQTILAELSRLKTKLGIHADTPMPIFSSAKTPSQVYEKMWTASYLLDALAGQIDPSFVFRNSRIIVIEIDQIAKKLGLSNNMTAPSPIHGKAPRDVNIQAFKNLYAIARLQRSIKIPTLIVPSFPTKDIQPSDVYDTSNIMLAELVRIKVALDITTPPAAIQLISGKNPSDVLAQMQLINMKLKSITANL